MHAKQKSFSRKLHIFFGILVIAAVLQPVFSSQKLVSPATFEDIAIGVIQEQDFTEFAQLIHPEKGIRFSPNAYIREEADINFTQTSFSEAVADNRTITWGVTPAKGDEIKMTIPEYWGRYVYDVDYVNVNNLSETENSYSSSELINHEEVYRNAKITQYRNPGTDPRAGGLDWTILYLVSEEFEGAEYLIGIIHNEWTP